MKYRTDPLVIHNAIISMGVRGGKSASVKATVIVNL